jgi:hypothetical protein
MEPSWLDSVFRQRAELARMIRDPLASLARKFVPASGDRDRLNAVLLEGFTNIPYCTCLYVVGPDGVQASDTVGNAGLISGHYRRNLAESSYMKEAMPVWGSCFRTPTSAWPRIDPR